MKTLTNWEHFLGATIHNKSFLFFCAFALAVYVLIYVQEEWEGIQKVICDDLVVTTIRFTPICIVIIVIMAGISRLDKANPGVSSDIIAGKYGEVTAVVVAAIMPGGAGGGQLRAAWVSGENRDNVLVCLHAMMALSLNGFMFRSTYLGWKLTLIWAGMSTIMLLQVYVVGRILKPWL